MLVFDITNPISFANIVTWKGTFMTKSEPKEPHTLPFLVLGNKCDEEGARKVSTVEAAKFCEDNGFIYFETSAKDNLNIEAAFKELVKKVIIR